MTTRPKDWFFKVRRRSEPVKQDTGRPSTLREAIRRPMADHLCDDPSCRSCTVILERILANVIERLCHDVGTASLREDDLKTFINRIRIREERAGHESATHCLSSEEEHA